MNTFSVKIFVELKILKKKNFATFYFPDLFLKCKKKLSNKLAIAFWLLYITLIVTARPFCKLAMPINKPRIAIKRHTNKRWY
jgi:hypothetical protein